MATESDYPLLSRINTPADLRKFDVSELAPLAAEIRRYIIEVLAVHPGHFASSMGAVELTVALHYVFDTPNDRIVWDVGHQAYAHKLLTGRRKEFHTLRTQGGLSGFPTPSESEYDTFTAGHASNSISAALGMAVAAAEKGENRRVVAVIGDASIGGGLAFEALNNAANANSDLLIILNDNDMSIDRNVGSLNSYLGHITTSKAYNKLRYKTYNALRRLHLVGERQRGFIMRFNNSLKSLINRQQNIFEGLNLRYFGPFNGHDMQRIVTVLRDIKDMRGPRLLHLRTVKGKGFAAAEADPAAWHAPGKFDPVTGEKIKEASKGPKAPKFQEVFGKTLVELAEQNENIIAVTAAMPSGTSVNLMGERFPKRTFDVGISEGHAVTFAGGMAKDGLRPFVAIYSSFLQRGYDHIIHDVAIQQLPVTFCIDRAGLVGEDGVTHHGVFDLSYLRPIPGMIIAAPRNEHYLRHLMYTAERRETSPMAIRYPRGRGSEPDWQCAMRRLDMGRGECLRQGTDVAILCLGPLVFKALKAAEQAAERGISVAVYDMIFLKPLDEKIMHEVADMDCPVITVEDASINGGLGSAVTEWLSENDTPRTVRRIGIPDRFIHHGTPVQLYHDAGMDAEAIGRAIDKSVKKEK